MKLIWMTSLALVTLAACGGQPASMGDAEPRVVDIMTAPDVTIEVLEWGGSANPALVFLAGGGHTAHVFDEFAPLLSGDFRVIGITRRGIGASSGASPETLDDHVRDIAIVLDSLKLGPVVLVGHSFAGMEMALFAEKYGDRCRGLVYLDAAYDYTDPELETVFETPPPVPPAMTRADSASVEAARAFNQQTQGFSIPASEIKATVLLDGEGRLIGRAPNTAMGVDLRAPQWQAVQCPALGLYAVTAPLQTWLPYYAARYDSLDAAERERDAAYVQAFGAWTAKQRTAFGRLQQNQVIEYPRTGHYFFLERPREVAGAIREFVTSLR